MTRMKEIKSGKDEKTWAVCAGCFIGNGQGCITIPVTQFEDLSNEEIGLRVRQLRWHARFLRTEELADYIEAHNIRHAPLDELIEWYPRLREFAGDDEKIKRAMEYVGEQIDRKQRRQKAHKSKAKKRNQITADYDWFFVQIGRRDGFACADCGSTGNDLQIDHVIPLAEDGDNSLENLQLLCPVCNVKKSDSLAN